MLDKAIGTEFPALRKMARLKARAASGFTPADRDDIEGHLLVTVCARLPQYDCERASLPTFCSRVMDNELVSLARRRCCRPDEVQLEDTDGDGPPTAPGVVRYEFWIDAGRVLDALPAALRETALALSEYSPTELSSLLGRSRTCLYRRIARIREAFLAAGIGPDYFARAGGVH